MLNQEPQPSDTQSKEGQVLPEPTVIPMEDPAAAETQTITAENAEAVAGQSQGAPQAGQETDVQYWKRVAEQNRASAEKFTQYASIINHLEKTPEHIDVLTKGVEGHTIGIIAAENMAQHAETQRQPSREELLSAELGVEASPVMEGTPMQQQAPAPKAHQPTSEELIKFGEEQAKAKMEFTMFREDMARPSGSRLVGASINRTGMARS